MRSVVYEPDSRVLSGLKVFTTLAATVVVLASLFVLSAWAFDISQFKKLFPSLETTKPLGAMGFLLAGTALLLLRHEEDKTKSWQRLLGMACASLALIIGSLVLLEYGFGVDFGVDRWLFREAVMTQGGSFPGRPILAISVCLAIMGLALLAIHSRVIWFDLLVLVVLFFGLVALTGYVYSSTALFSLNMYQSLPLASVFVIIFLALGYLSARPRSILLAPITTSLAGGTIARRLLPITVLFPLGLVWLRFIGQRMGLYNDELGRVLFASASMLVFAVLVYWNAMKLNEADAQRDAVRATLEQRVVERTQQLELERARWQGIVEGIADEVWSCDAQGNMSLLNLGTITAMGLKAFKDKSVYEVYQEVDIFYLNGQPRPPEQAPLLRSLRDEIVRGEEIMRHRQTGLTRYRQFSSAPIRDASGAITGAVAIVRDITDQKHAEEGLHRFELLSEYSKDIVLFISRDDGRILEANLAAQRAYGYTRDELLSLPVRKLRARGTQELTGDQVIRADQEGILYETIHQHRDGSTFPVEISSQGAVIGGLPTLINIVRDITERKQAEAKLAYQAELLANVRDAVVGTDEKLQVSFWNVAAEEMFGWTADEAIGKETAQLFKTQIPGYSREEAIQKLMTMGEFDGEVSYARKDDSHFIGHARSIAMRGPQGAFKGLVTTVRDITERKQAEERQAYLASFPERNPNPIIEADFDGQTLYTNPAALRAYPDLHQQGPALAWLVDWNSITRPFRENQTEVQTRDVVVGERVYQQTLQYLPQEHLIRIYGMDITERKQAEESLRQTTEELDRRTRELNAILSSVQDYVYIYDPAGRFVFANKKLLDLWGLTAEQAAGKTMRDLNYPETVETALLEGLRRVFETSKVVTNVTPYISPTNVVGSYENILAPMFGPDGKVSFVAGSSRDITERERTATQLSNALREKEALLKEIHHRVKNNLQVISSLLRLQAGTLDDPQIRELLSDSQRRVRAMALIHEQLYQSSSLAQINLKDYIQKLVHYLHRSYTQAVSNVQFHVTVEDMNIEIEQAVPLGLTISELVSNSLKHAFSSLQPKQVGEVWITAQRESSGNLVVSVGDNGAGMPENLDLDQLPTLGLQLVRSFVDQLQGQLTIQRKPGTIFTFTIPEKKG